MSKVLEIENLRISFETFGGQIHAVRGIDLSIDEGEVLALVGESGCGKSVSASAILGLNPPPPLCITRGSIRLCGNEMTALKIRELENIRGLLAGMVFQDPLNCLNPTMKIGLQITETLFRKMKMSRSEAEREAIRLLELVQIPNANIRVRQYPHQLSGGMRQRVMIAMALAQNPKLLIADEPTTALDVTIQLEILKLLKKIRTNTGLSMLLITHDFGVVANMADTIAVMYAGRIVEVGKVSHVLGFPRHPYTIGLLNSLSPDPISQNLQSIPGSPPDLFSPPAGCSFSPRCSFTLNICRREPPPFFETDNSSSCACWRLHERFRGKEAAL